VTASDRYWQHYQAQRNALALDVQVQGRIEVILDMWHRWNTGTPLQSLTRHQHAAHYKRFRNQVQNMTTIYGSGKELWKKFNDVCQMAANLSAAYQVG
jgi:hypothetical protein